MKFGLRVFTIMLPSNCESRTVDYEPYCAELRKRMCTGNSRDGSVGIATRYGPDGPGIESRCGGEIFRTRPDRPLGGPPGLLYNGYRVFPGGKAAGAWR